MAKKRAKKKKEKNRHRPVFYKTKKGWRRAKRSRLFPNSVTLEGRRVAEKKEPIYIKEGFLMAKGKRKMSAKQKAALARGRRAAAARRFGGFEGYKKKAKVRHVVRYGGDPGPDITGTGIDLAGLLAGAIGLSMVASIIPIKNPKFKALIPIAAGFTGILVPAIASNRFGSRAALGALAIGAYSLTKQLVPKMPLMGATDTAEGIGAAIENLPPEEKAILGLIPENTPQIEYQGQDPDPDTMGETELIEGVPGEMLGNLPGEMLGSDPGEMLGSDPGEMLGETEVIGAADDSSDFD